MTGREDNGEWAVSYHGTRAVSSVDDILRRGYDPSKTKTNACGFDDAHKVYSTPDINVAAGYSEYVEHKGQMISFVFQNRINPRDMQVSTSICNYWGAGMNTMRPYGLLVKVK